MKDTYDPLLNTDQDNINRQFKKRIEKLEKSASNSYDDSEIKSDIDSLEARIEALEDASNSYDDSEIKSDIDSLEARIKALEDAS